jgi:integrase
VVAEPSRPTPERPFDPRFSVYVLRHTSATLPVRRGEATLLEVSRRLGHYDPMFTARTYAHVKAEDTKAVASSFEKRAGAVRRLALVS